MFGRNGRVYGVVLVATSAVLWSTAGLFVRFADLDTWTMVAWRSVFTFLTLGAFAVAQDRGRLRRVVTGFGVPELVTMVLAIISTVAYVLALRLTTVANVMTVFAVVPFIATGIAFVWLGERVTIRFLVAGLFALAGIASMAGAAATGRDLLGLLAAFVMTAGFGTQLVHNKRYPDQDMTLLIALAAGLCVPIALPFMSFELPTASQLAGCAAYGIVTTGLAYILALKGAQIIPSSEAALISILEVVLGPFWVWLFYAEKPSGPILISSAVVLAAVFWYLATNKQIRADGTATSAMSAAKS